MGKTTMALAFSKALGLSFQRVQFTPETTPADVAGFSFYNRVSKEFEYRPGAVLCNLFLADEINRTSAKTQSALLEVMEERQVTVDGVTHRLPSPFIVIATQNPLGSAGTHLLPESQLDRFMLRLSIGYPDLEHEVQVLKQASGERPLDSLEPVLSPGELEALQKETEQVHVAEELYRYIARLAAATRSQPQIRLGASPRAGAALLRVSRACAWVNSRDYLIPADVQALFFEVMEHRVLLSFDAISQGISPREPLTQVLKEVPAPRLLGKEK